VRTVEEQLTVSIGSKLTPNKRGTRNKALPVRERRRRRRRRRKRRSRRKKKWSKRIRSTIGSEADPVDCESRVGRQSTKTGV
jgi:hypothetical protein